jgi:hypothetical protein
MVSKFNSLPKFTLLQPQSCYIINADFYRIATIASAFSKSGNRASTFKNEMRIKSTCILRSIYCWARAAASHLLRLMVLYKEEVLFKYLEHIFKYPE